MPTAVGHEVLGSKGKKRLFLPPYPCSVVVSVYTGYSSTAEQLLLENPHVQFHVPTASKLLR